MSLLCLFRLKMHFPYFSLDMLNNSFCFHVYAQKSLSHSHSLTLSISHLLTLDMLNMLNSFCFHVYAQKWLFVIMSHVICDHMSHFACHMSYIKWLWWFLGHVVTVTVTVPVTCLCWSLAHAEQFLFSCLCSKVNICNYVTFRMSHDIC